MDLSYILNELGEDRAHYFNAIAPPIMQTSNFRFNKVDELRAAFADEMSTYLYSRGLNPTVDILRKKLAALDGAEDCLIFNNGAAAIFAAVLANVKAGDHIVSVSKPYTWVQRMFDVILPRFGVSTTYVDGRDANNYFNATKSNTTFYYLESPNSWDFALQDIATIAAYAKQHNIVTLIDNSYCTPLYQQPIAMGIDMAMQTATKYIGGHSDTLGGVLSGSKEMIKRIFDSEYLNIGSGIQPFNAWLLIRGLRTLPTRLERINRSTKEVLAFVKAHPAVKRVLYPFDESFPQHQLARQQMKEAPGLFSLYVQAESRQQIVTFCESLQHIQMAVSWGGHESLLLPKCAGMQDEEFDATNAEHQMMRMYVGLEDAAYIIADLDQAFAKAGLK
ncbi:cystathionine beta-lyase/cystathionine gamma-synthase [Lacibacter cauensis]|uniref:Cystathionine beta-lyase/cystathionine gamma-synthase n=1 Tax=Lacibacter cauensis TaxID=510947 RepID=A0A562SQG1_9BACT|nr:PLP-dependent transferase [Lacibacter cauensis]TWI83408.1 cystathionine beta-lyase/cystathionine gamma-synthase [Lacibacter cauensis]